MTALVAVGLLIAGCGGDDEPDPPSGPESSYAIISADARFSILVEALDRTGLDATLSGEGSFTLFAPTDAAFNDLFTEMGHSDLDELVNAVSVNGLRDILLYHVLTTQVRAGNFTDGYLTSASTTSAGDSLSMFLNTEGSLVINAAASIEESNIMANNGVVHAIDAVLTPRSIWQLLSINAGFSSLTSATMLADGNLDDFLNDEAQSLTIFAPDDQAFDDLVDKMPGINNLVQLAASIGTQELGEVIKYHALSGVTLAADLTAGQKTTLGSDGSTNFTLFVNITSNGVRIIDNSTTTDDATVVLTNIVGTNGVIHSLDAVLLPE